MIDHASDAASTIRSATAAMRAARSTSSRISPVVADLGLLVPLENENRWTDLLAVLIATDPAAAAGVLGLGDIAGRAVTVSREVRAGRSERVDLQVHVDGRLHAVLEAKVLSGLGYQQLARYGSAYRTRPTTCWSIRAG